MWWLKEVTKFLLIKATNYTNDDLRVRVAIEMFEFNQN
jgi:hypothetical protein